MRRLMPQNLREEQKKVLMSYILRGSRKLHALIQRSAQGHAKLSGLRACGLGSIGPECPGRITVIPNPEVRPTLIYSPKVARIKGDLLELIFQFAQRPFSRLLFSPALHRHHGRQAGSSPWMLLRCRHSSQCSTVRNLLQDAL